MGVWDKIFRTSSGKRFNCKKIDEEGFTKVVCRPIEEIGQIAKPLSSGEVVFRIMQDPRTGRIVADVIDDGGSDRKTLEELDQYIRYFLPE